ncbi:class I SAM-dependent methyltransferase [Bradyrhizobium septentrionale]|uniref:Class I SAM-dependent methyltransferase n=1 Tax=Bradyrhizobium septentrionale TaxID=1404411 RepID=A0A973W929_9BRAD|nr:class I SAM-dependent methyltransferase [Bradyrhizobium septentrionale]UGY18439.1 class I SAM-dependent methyltransferase [Bradyrhizobium septentrionale]UGY27188.1 class I SAM-dependent methyltransferase [Bradyrhizobium septentrionale]
MTLNPTAKNYRVAVAAYEAGRPSYPADIVAALPLQTAHCVVDLGAGTGKFTRLLLPHLSSTARLVAVEPVAEMSARLTNEAGIEVINTRADAIDLATGSVDLVTCAQAFHWFDNEPSVAEIARLLRPGGTLALVWNNRDDRAPWVDALSVMIEGYAGDTPRQRSGRWRWILNDPRFVLEREIVQDHPHRMGRQGVYERVVSTSYVANLPDAEKAVLREKTDVILREAGLGDADEVVFPYVTHLYLLKRT